MDVRRIRKARLKALVEKYGGQAELARRVDTPPAYISQLLNIPSRNVGHEFARKIEKRLGYPEGWMDQPGESVEEPSEHYVANALAAETTRIPVINYIQAGRPREVVDSFEPGDGADTIGVDPELAAELGPHAFALAIEGESMLPDYQPGDLVIVDPDAPIRPGDIVVAKVGQEQNATVKKYRSRGLDRSGTPIFELVPLNDDYPTITVDATTPGELIGPVVEHRRRLRFARKRTR